jgi:hypothetical protein
MACHFFDGKVGYHGQRYAVVAEREDGTSTRLGWQDADVLSAGWTSLALHFGLHNLRLEQAVKDDV